MGKEMARMKVLLLLAIPAVVGYLMFWLVVGDTVETQPAKHSAMVGLPPVESVPLPPDTLNSAATAPATPEQVEDASVVTVEKIEDSNPALEKALESMNESLAKGDSRTPEMAPVIEREKPSPAVLADPAQYEAYELAQGKTIATVYLSILHQIPVIKARIDAAKASGSRSSEEIAEAEEAVEKLETLKKQMEVEHPEMLEDAKTIAPESRDDTTETLVQ